MKKYLYIKYEINAHKMLHRNITEFSSVEKYGNS